MTMRYKYCIYAFFFIKDIKVLANELNRKQIFHVKSFAKSKSKKQVS